MTAGMVTVIVVAVMMRWVEHLWGNVMFLQNLIKQITSGSHESVKDTTKPAPVNIVISMTILGGHW